MDASILLIDDDYEILDETIDYLKSAGYNLDSASSGIDGISMLKSKDYDCIILGIVLPDLDGFSLCRTLRTLTKTPIIFLSSMDGEENKVQGLMVGGDDYMTKPFSLKELEARIYAQIRRTKIYSESHKNSVNLDKENQKLQIKSEVVSLSRKETELIALFLKNPKKTYRREELFDLIWTEYNIEESNTVVVHIKKLRDKLKEIGSPNLIETIYKEGYRLSKEVSRL